MKKEAEKCFFTNKRIALFRNFHSWSLPISFWINPTKLQRIEISFLCFTIWIDKVK